MSVVEATKAQFIQAMRSIEDSSLLLGWLMGIPVSGTNHMLVRGLSVPSGHKIHQEGKTDELLAVVVLQLPSGAQDLLVMRCKFAKFIYSHLWRPVPPLIIFKIPSGMCHFLNFLSYKCFCQGLMRQQPAQQTIKQNLYDEELSLFLVLLLLMLSLPGISKCMLI